MKYVISGLVGVILGGGIERVMFAVAAEEKQMLGELLAKEVDEAEPRLAAGFSYTEVER